MGTSKINKHVVAAACLLAFWPDGTAVAQEIPRGETVKSRPKPELDPLGIKAGDFIFSPKATLSDSYNDNIMSASDGEISDHIVQLELKGTLKSDWNLHSVKVSGDVKVLRYIDNPDEDYEDYKFTSDGRYDLSTDLNITGGADILFGHESRSSPDDAGGIEPTLYRKFTIDGGFDNSLDPYSIRGGFVIDKYDYDDVTTTGGEVNNDDRDRMESIANIRGGYEFTPESEAFMRLELNNRSYKDALDDNGYNRDSNGFEVTGGLSFDLTGITFGNVFAGYRLQSFRDDSLKRARGPSAGLDITWNASPITTVTGSIERTVEETTSTGASGVFRTKTTIGVDHELLRNMIVDGKLTYTLNDYVGIGRKDKEPKLNFGIDYKLFRNLYSKFNYNYSKRDSTADGSDYRQHVYKIQLSIQL